MSDRSSPADAFEDAIQSPYSLIDVEETADVDLSDCVFDDTCSSYCTAVSSPSDFDELLKERAHSPTLIPCESIEVSSTTSTEVNTAVATYPSSLQQFNNTTNKYEEKNTPFHKAGEGDDSKTTLPLTTGYHSDKELNVLIELTQEVNNFVVTPETAEEFNSKNGILSGLELDVQNPTLLPHQLLDNMMDGILSPAKRPKLITVVPLTISQHLVSITPHEELSDKTDVSVEPSQKFVTAVAHHSPGKRFESDVTGSLTFVQESSVKIEENLPALSPKVTQVAVILNESSTSLLKEISHPGATPLTSPITSPGIYCQPESATTNEAFNQAPNKPIPSLLPTRNVHLSKPPRSSTHLPARDIIKVRMATHTDTNTTAEFRSSPRQLNPNTILITPKRNQYSQEINGSLPDKMPPKQGPYAAEVADCRLLQSQEREAVGCRDGVWEGRGSSASCREQTDLSVSDRNRNASASCISTLTGSPGKTGIPPHCYSKCILATDEQHQPQSPPKLRGWQKQGGQFAWRSAAHPQTPCCRSRKDFSTTQLRAGNNNMGTQFSEADGEVKTLRNQPVKTFSYPETNYLDVYNLPLLPESPQPTTESGLNSWAGEGLPFKLPMTLSPGNHNTSACSETSSVECIDVALETHEEVQRGSMKTVPKRQIQLKRKDTAELTIKDEKSCSKSQGPSRPRDLFLRQHSTPASLHQEPQELEEKPTQADRKQRLQKSLSLDETSSRTKMASCLIANVLSKKMQHEQVFRNADGPENAYATLKTQVSDQDYYQLPSAKEVTHEQPVVKTNMSVPSKIKAPTHSPPAKGPVGSVKEHVSVNSKTQQKVFTKHSFNPLHCGPGWAEFQNDSPEITSVADSRKVEKPTPQDEPVRLSHLSPGEKLSCDSAKGRAGWNSSAAISKDMVGAQACLKTTPEECYMGKGNPKQQPILSKRLVGKAREKDTRKDQLHGGSSNNNTEMSAGLQRAENLLADLELSSNETNQPLPPECASGKWREQQADKGDLKAPGPFLNTHDKLKGIAPVHVIRDMRSLVKNPYNLSFRGPGDPFQHLDDSCTGSKAAIVSTKSTSKSNEMFGFGDRQLGKKGLASPPVQTEKPKDSNSQHSSPSGGCNKLDIGFTKVSPTSLSVTSSCLETSALKGINSSGSLCKRDGKSDNVKCKPVDRAERHQQAQQDQPAKMLRDGQVQDGKQELVVMGKRNDTTEENMKSQGFTASTMAATISEGYPSATLVQGASLSLPPSTQATPTCVLTRAITPAQVLPPYYYKANPMSYQAISPQIAAMGFMQAPMILQAAGQPSVTVAAATMPSILVRQSSEDGRQMAASIYGDACQSQRKSSKHTVKGEVWGSTGEVTRPSPESQAYLCGTQTVLPVTMTTSETHMAIYPDLGGCLIQGGQGQPVAQPTPRHVLLDPETGRCFYVDMPVQSQPQRKMLFDPETCQYVEVLLPQPSLPSAAIMPTSCTVPLSLPAVFTPYLQSHTQVLSPPGP